MGTSKGGGKQWNLPLRNRLECSVPEPYRSPAGLWFLPKPAFGLNTNDDDETYNAAGIFFFFSVSTHYHVDNAKLGGVSCKV